MFKAIRVRAGYRKRDTQVVLCDINYKVGLKVEDQYYAQQFGTLEQATAKFKELKATIQNGGKL